MLKMNLVLGLLLSLVLGGGAFAAATTSVKYGLPQPAAVETMLNASATNPATAGLGTQVTQKKLNVLKAVYDFTKLGGSSATIIKLKDASGGYAVLPKGAIIWDGVIDTITALDSAGSATVSLGINTAIDLKAATAMASYTGLIATIPLGTAASAVKVTTANSVVTATIGTADLRAGKFNVFLYYVLSE